MVNNNTNSNYYKLSNVDINYSESGMSGILTGGGGLEVELPSPESRRGSMTILDHIKRSAGNTPAKTKISQPHQQQHQQQQQQHQHYLTTTTIGNSDANHHIRVSNNEGFSISLTASTSDSTTDDDTADDGLASTSVSLFQTSQLLSQKEDEGPDFSTHDDGTYDDDRYEMRVCHDDERRLLHNGPLYSVSSLEEQFLYTNFEPPSPQRIAGHHISRTTRMLHGLSLSALGHPDSTALMMPQQRKIEETISKAQVETSPISPSSTPQSHGSNNDDSTCWIEDGGNRISSLFDHNTIGLDKIPVESVIDYESEDDDDDDDDDDGEFTVDGSQYTMDDRPLNAVESFLDELTDVEDVNQLRNLLFQMGSCHFSGQETVDDSKEDYYSSNRSRDNSSSHRSTGRASGDTGSPEWRDQNLNGEYRTKGATSASQYSTMQPTVSSSPKNLSAPQPTVVSSAAVMDEELTTVDSFSLNLLLQNWSLQADTLMDIVTNSTTLSQTTDGDEEFNLTPISYAGYKGDDDDRPKKLTAMAFLSSMFGCQQGGGHL